MVAWSPDAKYLATGDVNGAIWLWDPLTGLQHGSCMGHKKYITALVIPHHAAPPAIVATDAGTVAAAAAALAPLLLLLLLLLLCILQDTYFLRSAHQATTFSTASGCTERAPAT